MLRVPQLVLGILNHFISFLQSKQMRFYRNFATVSTLLRKSKTISKRATNIAKCCAQIPEISEILYESKNYFLRKMKKSFASLIVPLRLSLELVLLGEHGEARGQGRRLVRHAVAVEGVHDPLHAGHEAALLLHLRGRMNG